MKNNGGKYKPYPAYKPSGVEWIGEIPEGWAVRKVKYTAPTQSIKSKNNEYKVALENIEGFSGRFIETEASFDGEGIAFDNNSILYGKLRPYLCKVFLPKQSGICVSEFLVLVPNNKLSEKKFIFYFLLSYLFTDIINGATFGSKMPRADWKIVGNFMLTLPPLPEQQAIADFLDRETARINGIVEKQTRMIELLKEKRYALITQAVTKGLDPKAKMKPSGVEWLGKIPEHWEIRKLKFCANVVLGKMICTNPQQGMFLKPYLKSRNISWEKVIVDDVDEMYFYPFELELYRLKKNDVLVSEGGEVGKTCIWNDEIKECYIQNSVHKVTCFEYCYHKYLLYLFVSLGKNNVFQNIVNQVSIGHLTKEKLVKLLIVLPPFTEQQGIADFLDRETTMGDKLIEKIEKQIELLNEYRQSLITSAVTGKIDVSTALNTSVRGKANAQNS